MFTIKQIRDLIFDSLNNSTLFTRVVDTEKHIKELVADVNSLKEQDSKILNLMDSKLQAVE
jgi:hypothetical protein